MNRILGAVSAVALSLGGVVAGATTAEAVPTNCVVTPYFYNPGNADAYCSSGTGYFRVYISCRADPSGGVFTGRWGGGWGRMSTHPHLLSVQIIFRI